MTAVSEADLIEEILDSLAMGDIGQAATKLKIVRLTDGSLSVDYGGDTTFVVTVTAHPRIQ